MSANTYVENAWYVAGRSQEFPVNQPKGRKITGRPVLLWRTGEGKITAFDDRCVHKRMPLSEGRVLADGVLECAYHGFCYDGSGDCVRIPSQLDRPIPTRAKLKPFPVVEQHGLVWVWPGDPQKIGDAVPSPTPEISGAEWDTHMFDPVHVPANYVLLIENLMDITHFYPLHDGNIGDIEQSKIPIELVEERLNGVQTVKTIRRVQGYAHPPFMVEWWGFPVVDRWHTHHMLGPGLTRVELRCAAPGKLGIASEERGYVIHHAHTPMDGTSHMWRLWVSTRKEHKAAGDPSKSVTGRIAEMFPAVMDQDRWALERQQKMFEYPDDGYHEVFLRSDQALIRCRKILAEMEKQNRTAGAWSSTSSEPLSRSPSKVT
jgi:phenylpropionate dioxygenase-like ring-hydroxylating dioxygenase large terminal subunit